jgi:hypothetical protein
MWQKNKLRPGNQGLNLVGKKFIKNSEIIDDDL